jgi:hypothetical protein
MDRFGELVSPSDVMPRVGLIGTLSGRGFPATMLGWRLR